MTRLGPRFSLRTLAIVVSLICAYLASWEATKTWGIRQSHLLTAVICLASFFAGWFVNDWHKKRIRQTAIKLSFPASIPRQIPSRRFDDPPLIFKVNRPDNRQVSVPRFYDQTLLNDLPK